MQTKTFSRAALLIVASAGCAAVFLAFPFFPSLEGSVLRRSMSGNSYLNLLRADAGFPVRLRIPGIKVDAAIESVGLTSKGAMDVPKDPHNVGWYDLGPRPGEQGSAVMVGHLDWYNGRTAVFQHLKKLRKGDLLSVETSKGRFLVFVVREIRTYDPNEYAPDVFRKDEGIHLNLVTCDGVWDTARKIYTKRMVVFTDAVVLN